jgi:tetratricopeptide (TPR) repeat protein
MASLIPGFEYDIFISYRQKDNKGDRWVSNFVDALKIEIESTFKEEVSIYFDINPHDGLLETHDVDASLKEKLKCLVFIPILSRTYCDPKSFAWEHEFKAFLDQAHIDQFGLKVSLPHGNVASRVLPVRIHDLDDADIKLCETSLGGVIRGIDFVYKESGVNRPLTPEDDGKKNLNNTLYRNQINKTANAIKEIISGLSSDQTESKNEHAKVQPLWQEVKPGITPRDTLPQKEFSLKTNRNVLIMLLIASCILGAYIVYRFLNLNKPGKTIAVYFSVDEKNDTALTNVGIVFTEAIYSKLYEIKSLTLRPRLDMHQFGESSKSINAIRKDLAVNYLLYGNIRKSGNDIIIWIELTSEKVKKDLWLKKYTWNKNLISQNTKEIVREIASNLKAKISPEELKHIDTEPTKNAEANLNYTYANAISYNAWSAFNLGNKYFESISFSSAIPTYDKAIKEDPQFAQAYAKRAIARAWGYYTRQLDSTHIGKCLADINAASKIDKDLPDVQTAFGFYYYYCIKDLDKALEYFNKASEKSPGDFQPLFYMAMVYRRKGDWYKSQKLIKKIIDLDPQDALCLTNIGMSYEYLHEYDSALIFQQKAIDVMPVWSSAYKNKIETLLLKNGNTSEARILVDSAIQKTGENFLDTKILLDIYDRKYSEALHEAEISVPSDYEFSCMKYMFLANINSYLKKSEYSRIYYDSMFICLSDELKSDKNNPLYNSYLGIASAGIGYKEKAIDQGKKAVDLIKYLNMGKSDMIVNLARIYTMVGEYDQAISTIDYLLEKQLHTPSSFSASLLQLDPVWKPLLSIPAIKELLKKHLEK